MCTEFFFKYTACYSIRRWLGYRIYARFSGIPLTVPNRAVARNVDPLNMKGGFR